MLLPSYFIIEISQQKLTEYLRNAAHPDGGSKAVFFLKNGFEDPNGLRKALESMIKNHPVRKEIKTAYGTKFVVDGHLISPTKRQLFIRTVWIVLAKQPVCTFVTAYPL